METNSILVSPLLPEHWGRVREIYSEGIATGQATFETEVPDWDSWRTGHGNHPRLVAKQGSQIVGWAALSPVSDRCAYQGVAEVSVYVKSGHRGKGIGAVLLDSLIEESEKYGIWTLQAGVFPENQASIRLHKRVGFREVGVRERLGRLNGRWRDVVLLERRSPNVGVESTDERPGIG
ncbi:MAG: N-acetyltransferase family protein [Gemmatimonadales bacterium]|nr:MAG: N-acetyltransferase family protein [Gemmatimonadales bacterium]